MIFQDRSTGYVYQIDDDSGSGLYGYDRFRLGEVFDADYGRTRCQRLRSLLFSLPRVMVVAAITPEVRHGQRCERVTFGSRPMTSREWFCAIWRAID